MTTITTKDSTNRSFAKRGKSKQLLQSRAKPFGRQATAVAMADGFAQATRRPALVIFGTIRKLLAAAVLYDEASANILDGPGRREAAFGH